MKKILLFVLVFALALSANAFADTTNNVTAGSALELTGVTVGVSPKVFAHYENDDNDNAQWYGIATSHAGGTSLYGAAQNNSGTFKIELNGTVLSALSAKNAEGTTVTYTLPSSTQAASTIYWSDSAWDR